MDVEKYVAIQEIKIAGERGNGLKRWRQIEIRPLDEGITSWRDAPGYNYTPRGPTEETKTYNPTSQ